jgi:hypothetical protein
VLSALMHVKAGGCVARSLPCAADICHRGTIAWLQGQSLGNRVLRCACYAIVSDGCANKATCPKTVWETV